MSLQPRAALGSHLVPKLEFVHFLVEILVPMAPRSGSILILSSN